MSTTISPAPAFGSGRSPYWKTSGPPFRSMYAAFITLCLPVSNKRECRNKQRGIQRGRGACCGAKRALPQPRLHRRFVATRLAENKLAGESLAVEIEAAVSRRAHRQPTAPEG